MSVKTAAEIGTKSPRIGGHLLVECLEELGAQRVFGLPGVHALPMWDGLRASGIGYVGLRTELNAGFAADGYARSTGLPAVLLLSTGPGALNSLTALMEAATAHVPLVVIASQIPGGLIGQGRGYLHELSDQLACFEPVVKWASRVSTIEALPTMLAQAWSQAITAPSGPVFLEVPVDILKQATGAPADATPVVLQERKVPTSAALARAAALMSAAQRPVIWSGGGVLRSGASDEVAALARRLNAPVVTTFMGKGGFPDDDPLALGSAVLDGAIRDVLQDADPLICIGTELGSETTGEYSLRLPESVLHIDADARRIGANYPSTGLVGDAKATLAALLELLPSPNGDSSDAEDRVREARQRLQGGLALQGRERELDLLDSIAAVLPADAVSTWDMTILAYAASSHYPVRRPRRFLYPLGSGTLGYAWPAAIGAAAAAGEPALAVVGDGGFAYGMSELLSVRQLHLPAKLLLIDDGGYGILREYQESDYGRTYGVDLVQPNFVDLCVACGIPARRTSTESLEADLEWALATDGPAVTVLNTTLQSIHPTP